MREFVAFISYLSTKGEKKQRDQLPGRQDEIIRERLGGTPPEILRLHGRRWSGVPKGVPRNQDGQGKLVLARVADDFSNQSQATKQKPLI
jgi:hypothetical protein